MIYAQKQIVSLHVKSHVCYVGNICV